MDDDEQPDLGEVDFTPIDETVERLALLTLEEAHDLLTCC
ncbi:DUF6417 family protein [Streptomyces sp. Tue6028]